MGFIGMGALGAIFFFIKSLIDLYKVLLRKIKGDIYKGKIIKLKESYKSQSAEKIQNTYIYLIDVDMPGSKKQIEYKEVTEGKKTSNLKTNMCIDIYIDKHTQKIDIMKDLWRSLWSNLLGFMVLSILVIISFIVMVMINE